MRPVTSSLSLGVLMTIGLSLFGCSPRRAVPELLTLTGVTPARVEAGDRVDVFGVDLPASEVHGARVTLHGDFFRPGKAPIKDRSIEVVEARIAPDRVSFQMTDELLERIVGRDDGAIHTTFQGKVVVSLPSASSSTPVVGTVLGTTTIDFYPRHVRTPVADDRERDAQSLLDFAGIKLAEDDASAGVRVAHVEPGSPAASAGIQDQDRLVSVDGVTAFSKSDLSTSEGERSASIVVERGEDKPIKALDLSGFRNDASNEAVWGALVLAPLALLLILFGTRTGAAISWVEGRFARMTRPSRNERGHEALFRGWWGRLRTFTSRILQDVPRGQSGRFAKIAPLVVFLGVSCTFAVVPFLELSHRAELDIGVLYLLSFASYVSMSIVTGGHDAHLRWTPGVILKSLVRALACEIPAALSVATIVFLLAGSFRLNDIAALQTGPTGSPLETGGWPWYWTAIKSPQLFLMFFCFFFTVLVEPGRIQLPSTGAVTAKGLPAPSRSASIRQGAFFVVEWTNLFIMCALAAALFFGGWQLPGVSAVDLEASSLLQAGGAIFFLLKSWFLVSVIVALRASLPRLSSSQLLRLTSKVMPLVMVIGAGLTWLQVTYPPLPSVTMILTGTVLLLCILLPLSMLLSLRASADSRSKSFANAVV